MVGVCVTSVQRKIKKNIWKIKNLDSYYFWRFFGEKIKNKCIECCFACSLSFIYRSLFQLVVLRLGHVLASNCDLYFGYLLNFANLHSLFATPCYILCLSHSSTYTSISTGSSYNCYTQLNNRLYHPIWLW